MNSENELDSSSKISQIFLLQKENMKQYLLNITIQKYGLPDIEEFTENHRSELIRGK